MPGIWGELIHALGLEPERHRVGSPRPRQSFAGRVDGFHIEVHLDFERRGVRLAVSRREDRVLSGEDDWRLVPRAGLDGWPGGETIGDPTFDERVAILAEEPDALRLRLDPATRGLAAELIEAGAWVCDGMVLFEPTATAAIASRADAESLLEMARDLVVALEGARPEAIVEMAFGDPVPAQRRRAAARLSGVLRNDRGRAAALAAIARHRPPEGPALIERAVDAPWAEWWPAAQVYPAGDVARAILRRWSAGVDAEGEVLMRTLTRMLRRACAEADGAVLGHLARAVRDYTGLGTALVEAASDPASLRWLAEQPLPDEAARIGLIVRVHAEPRKALSRLEASRPTTAAGERALVAALDGLSDGVGEPALCRLRPVTPTGRQSLVGALGRRTGPEVDRALLRWAMADDGRHRNAVGIVARRVAAALDERASHPLAAAIDSSLPRPLEDAIQRALLEARPRFAAGWLSERVPDRRATDPQEEARFLALLGEFGDPAAEARCIAGLEGIDFLRVAAAEALARIGTVRAIPALDELTGFFAPSDVKAAARAAIDAIRDRETAGPRGGLTVSGPRGGEVSLPDEG